MLTRKPSASIVVVNYNGRVLLDACLRPTLAQASAVGAEVVVVDNASSDDSVELVEQHFPEAVLVRNRHNEGFAGGANAGVRAARSDCMVLLNNDAVPEEGWLSALLRALEPTDVAVAASVIDEERYPAAYALGTGTISVIGHPIPNVLRDEAAPFYATGTSLAFKRGLFPEPFDPLYFAYYEDVLLSWRARLRGYRVVRAVASRVRHIGGATAERRPTLTTFLWERNKLLTLLLCYELDTLVRLTPLYLFDGITRLTEQLWHLIGPRQKRTGTLAGFLLHYALVLRSLGWVALHGRTLGRLRGRIQAERRVRDRAITPLLSGKVFDDYQPTPVHRAANALAVAYCRLAGIRTAET